ncbi:MAG: MerC domain-containing protein [Bacteroidales bacterium]|jgi:nicotinamide riboside transporter PnuC|nr:MerC domain-containing protein [Bacteroidales bacterium]
MNKKNVVTSSLVGLLSSVLAFLGIISCCGFPLIAAFLAWFGIGASQLSFFAEYHTLFTVLAVVALIYGFYIIYLKKDKGSCCDTESQKEQSSCCDPKKKRSGWLAKSMLWIGVIAVISTFFMDNKPAETPQTTDKCCTTVTKKEPITIQKESSCCTTNKDETKHE